MLGLADADRDAGHNGLHVRRSGAARNAATERNGATERGARGVDGLHAATEGADRNVIGEGQGAGAAVIEGADGQAAAVADAFAVDQRGIECGGRDASCDGGHGGDDG